MRVDSRRTITWKMCTTAGGVITAMTSNVPYREGPTNSVGRRLNPEVEKAEPVSGSAAPTTFSCHNSLVYAWWGGIVPMAWVWLVTVRRGHMRRRVACTVLATVGVSAMLAGCTGGGEEPLGMSTVTATSTPEVTPIPTPSPTSIVGTVPDMSDPFLMEVMLARNTTGVGLWMIQTSEWIGEC